MLKKYFGDRGFWRTALRLAIPIALQNLLISSFSLVDTLMVGQLGDVALSSVGMAGQWTWMLNMVLFGVISGTSMFISQYWGTQDIKGIHRTYGIALTSALLISLVFTTCGFLFPRTILRVFNKEATIIETGSAYLAIACFSYPAVALSNILSTVLRSTEKVKLPLAVSSVTAVLNAIFNYALIFGKFGMPEMGVRGAALATVISAWAGPILIFLISLIRKNILIAAPSAIFHFGREHIAAFYRRAAPVMLNECMWGAGTLIFSIIYSNLGHEYYAAVTIHKTFENIAFVFFVGLCNACCIMVGKSVGAGKIRRAIEDSTRFMILVPLLSVLVGGLIVIFRSELVALFNMSDNISQVTVDAARSILMIYGLELPIRNIPYIAVVGVFRSGGDTVTAMKYDLISLWALSIPGTFLAAYVFRLPFPMVYAIMYLLEDYLKVFLCVRHVVSKKWIRPVTEEGVRGLEEYKKETAV